MLMHATFWLKCLFYDISLSDILPMLSVRLMDFGYLLLGLHWVIHLKLKELEIEVKRGWIPLFELRWPCFCPSNTDFNFLMLQRRRNRVGTRERGRRGGKQWNGKKVKGERGRHKEIWASVLTERDFNIQTAKFLLKLITAIVHKL